MICQRGNVNIAWKRFKRGTVLTCRDSLNCLHALIGSKEDFVFRSCRVRHGQTKDG